MTATVHRIFGRHPVSPHPALTSYVSYVPALFPLVLHWPMWIHRRVETITYVDEVRVKRHVSVDFSIPLWAYGDEPLQDVVVPIALLRKGPLKDFDVTDEGGRALTVLNRSQAQEVGGALLTRTAEVTLRRRGVRHMDPKIERTLGAIVASEVPSEALAMLEELSHSSSGGSRAARAGFDTQRLAIFQEGRTWVLANNLASSFVLFVIVPEATAGQRRMIKFEYEQDPKPTAGFGWLRGGHLTLDVPNASLGDSYHVEVAAPEDLFIHSGTLNAKVDEQDIPLYGVWKAGSTERLHLHVRHVPLGVDPILVIRFRIAPFGILSAAVQVGVICSAYLAGGLLTWRFLGTVADNGAAAAVVVALPGLFAAYTYRTGVHRLVRQVVSDVRYIVFGLTLASFASAALLAVSWRPGIRFLGWTALTLFALVATAYLLLLGLVNYRRLRRHPVKEDRRTEPQAPA